MLKNLLLEISRVIFYQCSIKSELSLSKKKPPTKVERIFTFSILHLGVKVSIGRWEYPAAFTSCPIFRCLRDVSYPCYGSIHRDARFFSTPVPPRIFFLNLSPQNSVAP